MESNRFKTLLQLKGIRDKETIAELDDFNTKFPWCQTSRLLYAKALHDQNSIHFDQNLKLAAAYASDREVLRKLIASKTEETEFEFPLTNANVQAGKKTTGEVPHSESSKPTPVKQERFEEWYSEDEISGRAFEEQKKQQKIVDPHEVIRKRLNEILSGTVEPLSTVENKPKLKIQGEEETTPTAETKIEKPVNQGQATKEQPNAVFTSQPLTPQKSDAEEVVYKEDLKAEQKLEEEISHPVQEKSEEEKNILAQAEKARDVLDKLELEHAMEESILDSIEKLPVIAPEKKSLEVPEKKPVKDATAGLPETNSPRSFTDWLKTMHRGNQPGYEEVRATGLRKETPAERIEFPVPADEEEELSDDELIEKFINEDPKIVPSKSEFYSPIAQAKKSVMDRDDVVSETLAKIYLSQGNTQKARWCYEKLMLLHPEKSAFFAALLKEIPEGSGQ